MKTAARRPKPAVKLLQTQLAARYSSSLADPHWKMKKLQPIQETKAPLGTIETRGL